MDQQYPFSSLVFVQRCESSSRSFANLYECPETKLKFMVKYFSKDMNKVSLEYGLISNFSHPNIIKAYKIKRENKEYLVTEFMNLGDLYKIVNQYAARLICHSKLKNFRFQETFWRTIFKQVVEGLVYLEDKGYAHCDIKPENIVLNDNFNVKLIDFEFCLEAKNEDGTPKLTKLYQGSPSYMAPEIRNQNYPYDPCKSDVFSMGTTLINLMFGHDFFPEEILKNGYPLMKWLQERDFEKIWNTFDKENLISFLAKDFIEHSLAFNANERWSFKELLSHAWFHEEVFTGEEMKRVIHKRIRD